MFKSLVVLAAALCVAYAAVAIGPLEPKPEKFKNQEGCYISALDEVIPFGEGKPSKTSCMWFRCGTEYVDYVACGPVVAVPPCNLAEDKNKPYPRCCRRVVCP